MRLDIGRSFFKVRIFFCESSERFGVWETFEKSVRNLSKGEIAIVTHNAYGQAPFLPAILTVDKRFHLKPTQSIRRLTGRRPCDRPRERTGVLGRQRLDDLLLAPGENACL